MTVELPVLSHIALAGPFDIIGDVHGCFDELAELLAELGYRTREGRRGDGLVFAVTPPNGRMAVFLGDLVGRGPKIPLVLRLVMSMVADGVALCVPGNHDTELVRRLRGENIPIAHGMAESLEQLKTESDQFRQKAIDFLDGRASHYVLDNGKLVVVHAGMKADMQGRCSDKVREFALYGETIGEANVPGSPIRHNWAAEYRGQALVVHGHTPVPNPKWLNQTVNIDTACVFGGSLTAFRYPEKEIVSVRAKRVYRPSAIPFITND